MTTFRYSISVLRDSLTAVFEQFPNVSISTCDTGVLFSQEGGASALSDQDWPSRREIEVSFFPEIVAIRAGWILEFRAPATSDEEALEASDLAVAIASGRAVEEFLVRAGGIHPMAWEIELSPGNLVAARRDQTRIGTQPGDAIVRRPLSPWTR